MRKLLGRAVSQGIALGPVFVLKKDGWQVRKISITDADAELLRLEKAVEQTGFQLGELYEKTIKEAGETAAAIFEAHRMLLEDEAYLEAIRGMIRAEMVNAEYAVSVTGERFAEKLAGMEDDYMRAREADIRDVSNRLARSLSGREEIEIALTEPSVIVAEELSPGGMIRLDKKKILALVTVRGSAASHTSILARMMNIPALTGVPAELEKLHTGMTAVVDGFQGEVIFEPTEEICRRAEEKIRRERESGQLLEALWGEESLTLDGRRIHVCANISGVEDISAVLESGADGIGLFRSEFLYLGRNDFPTEEEQFQAYSLVLRAMEGKRVLIRTLDIGADKQADYFHLAKERNPALGYRAIRICLKQPEIFKTQIRALLRASVFGSLSILYPMITSVEEVQRIYKIVEEVRAELDREGISYGMPRQGIMIETPAAVMISDELAQLVDFFSIGTNDLTQYTLALDRQDERLEEFYNPRHRAVFRMIRMAVDNAHRYGKWGGICGELAGDTDLTEEFIRMGVDELSVAPPAVPKVRGAVREAQLKASRG